MIETQESADQARPPRPVDAPLPPEDVPSMLAEVAELITTSERQMATNIRDWQADQQGQADYRELLGIRDSITSGRVVGSPDDIDEIAAEAEDRIAEREKMMRNNIQTHFRDEPGRLEYGRWLEVRNEIRSG